MTSRFLELLLAAILDCGAGRRLPASFSCLPALYSTPFHSALVLRRSKRSILPHLGVNWGVKEVVTSSRVVILYTTSAVLLIAFLCYHMYKWYNTKRFFSTYSVLFVFGATLCFLITGFSYFKVFRIIRHHQSQIQTNRNVIDIEKYKKSVFTILYILAGYFYCVTLPSCVAF